MERGKAKTAPRAQRGPARWLEPVPDRDGPDKGSTEKMLFFLPLFYRVRIKALFAERALTLTRGDRKVYQKNIFDAFMAEVYKAGSPQLMKQYAGDKQRRFPRAATCRRLQRLARYYFTARNGKAPRAYVLQCIEQTALSPFERAAMLAIFETMEIEK